MFKLVRANGIDKAEGLQENSEDLDEDLGAFEEDLEEELKQLDDDKKKNSAQNFGSLVKGFRKNKPTDLVRTFSMHKNDQE